MDHSKPLFVVAIVAIAFAATGCPKKDDAAQPAPAPSASARVVGCGSDYESPKKEFCIKVSADLKASPVKIPATDDRVDFSGPNGMVIVNATGTQTYEEGLKDQELYMGMYKVEMSGAMTAGTGQWRVYKDGAKTGVSVVVKANSGKAIRCKCERATAAEIDACKSLRAYPK